MKFSHSIVVALAVGLGLMTPVSEAGDQSQQPIKQNQGSETAKATGTLLEVLKQSEEYKLFLVAAESTGFIDQLKGEGPMTVFVPTNEAFKAFLGDDSKDVSDITMRSLLTSLLPKHVIPSQVTSKELSENKFFQALNDQRMYINQFEDVFAVDDSIIIKADIQASNGVIHVIDKVMMAESKTTLCIPLGDEQHRFKTYLKIRRDTGRLEGIHGAKSVTSFVPTDAAFAKLPKELIKTLMKPENKALRNKVISNHFIADRAYSDMAEKNATVKSAAGGDIKLTMKDGVMYVNGAKVIEKDIETKYGVVHLIDTVLLPTDLKID